jgi:hypothetical protein
MAQCGWNCGENQGDGPYSQGYCIYFFSLPNSLKTAIFLKKKNNRKGEEGE